MRPRRARLKLRMELTSDEPRMGLQLYDLDQRSVGGQSTQSEAVLDELIAVLVVDFVAVPMALAHLRHAIDCCGLGSDAQSTRISTEAHGASHIGDVLLAFHQR